MRDRRTLAYPSERVASELRRLGEVAPIITDEDWASPERPAISDLNEPHHRTFFNKLVAYYNLNRNDSTPTPMRAGKVRKALDKAARQVRELKKALSPLNSENLLEARAKSSQGGTPEDKLSNAKEQIISLQRDLEKLVSDLKHAREQLPQGKRITTKKSEVLYHCIYAFHVYLRQYTGKGLSRGGSLEDEARLNLAVWLFQIADPSLPPETIKTAAQKAIRELMRSDEHLDIVHPTIAPIFPGYFED